MIEQDFVSWPQQWHLKSALKYVLCQGQRTRRRTKESSEEKGDPLDDVEDSKDKYNDSRTGTKENKEKGGQGQEERTRIKENREKGPAG